MTITSRQHPRDVTGRPPTFSDFSPEGKALAERQFSEVATKPATAARRGAANAGNRIKSWRENNPGKEDNAYVRGETRRQSQLKVAAKVLPNRSQPVTMNDAASRLVENYDMAAVRTQTGNIGMTEANLGAASLSRMDMASARHAAIGRGTVTPEGTNWYPESANELTHIAAAVQADPRQTIVGATTMSPQNAPQNERVAARAITLAQADNRSVSFPRPGKKTRAHAAAAEALDMKPGSERKFSDFTPAQVAHLARHRGVLGGDVDLPALGKGGTELAAGVSTLRGERGQEDLGGTGKVPSYVHQTLQGGGHASLGEPGANANVMSEYHRRVHESIPGNHPYFEQPTLFGEAGEADPYGQAHSTQGLLNPGHQPEAPHAASAAAHSLYPDATAKYEADRMAGSIHLHEGTTAQDTWMMAQSLALPRDQEGLPVGQGANPPLAAKVMASDPTTVNFGGKHMPTGRGERKLSSSEAQHAVFNEITNRAAGMLTDRARQAGRNVGAGVPVAAVQPTTWTGYRQDMGKDVEYRRRQEHIASSSAPTVDPNQRSMFGDDLSVRKQAVTTPSMERSNARATVANSTAAIEGLSGANRRSKQGRADVAHRENVAGRLGRAQSFLDGRGGR